MTLVCTVSTYAFSPFVQWQLREYAIRTLTFQQLLICRIQYPEPRTRRRRYQLPALLRLRHRRLTPRPM